MLKQRLLHPEILEALASAGHGSRVLITDGNYPAGTRLGENAALVFLNLAPGKPTVTEVLDILLTAIMEDGQWLDAIFWIERGTPTPSLKLFAWQTENPNIYYTEKRLLNGLEEANMFAFSFDIFFGDIAVDSFQMISGNLESYLWANAPAFSKNYEDVTTLFNADLNEE